ncbi:MAG: DUF6458 family protein [Aeromicrobium sp.]|uniref:DUF6458 family protein n=1 Tax=Aeromicrobium sp. TaxID=1871063 RepID=UPI0025BCA2F1|nr:DUF6458 family protein [Aeromicrobium sp.]MCK5890703.1 hypothetical protein [Aeromicrobium sp.]MDF1703328.1 DUF6458 family protein [Aeromicrobium sp.]
MQIGGSLFLLAVGAILAFAVRDSIEAVDLTMVGYILLVVGAIGLAISLIVNGQRRGRDELPPPR